MTDERSRRSKWMTVLVQGPPSSLQVCVMTNVLVRPLILVTHDGKHEKLFENELTSEYQSKDT